MALYTVTTGNTILAADLNQLVNALQEPAGNTELGFTFVESGTGNATGWTMGGWIQSQSRTSVPASCTLSSISAVSVSSPTTQQLSSSGVFIGAGSTGTSNTARFSCNYTFQY